ncbi:MAG: hypothetical protein AAFX87_20335 [Bacteroidota bacterium]
MKHLIRILVLNLIWFQAFSQDQNDVDILAKQFCDCMLDIQNMSDELERKIKSSPDPKAAKVDAGENYMAVL